MAVRLSSAIPRDLRYEPTPKWIRAERDGEVVVDSRRALLVWGRNKVVPQYAFPAADVRADLLAGAVEECTDEDLSGFVSVEWSAVDRWLEEEEEAVGHPRDPFHRIDIRLSSRHVEVSLDGETVADSRRPVLLFETGLPVRHYLPRDDVRMDLLTPSEKRTTCAYKGHASYFSAPSDPDIAWTYEEPLPDAEQIRGLIAFFGEHSDIAVDGQLLDRPRTEWS
jgi:uncharacterized protein (DUF427 family)